MHHAPRELNQREYHILAKHLRIGGSWLQLAYPLGRWQATQVDEFCPKKDKTIGTSFDDGWWGGDGCRTPYAEWYEPGKWWKTLQPYTFLMDWCGVIGKQPPEFIWFKAIKTSDPPSA